jgi:hypothetical protein
MGEWGGCTREELRQGRLRLKPDVEVRCGKGGCEPEQTKRRALSSPLPAEGRGEDKGEGPPQAQRLWRACPQLNVDLPFATITVRFYKSLVLSLCGRRWCVFFDVLF